MREEALRAVVSTIAAECREDYVGLWEVIREVKRALPGALPADVQSATLEVIRRLLQGGYAVAGDFSTDMKFFDWRMTVDLTVNRIKEEWDLQDREPDIGDVVWMTAPR